MKTLLLSETLEARGRLGGNDVASASTAAAAAAAAASAVRRTHGTAGLVAAAAAAIDAMQRHFRIPTRDSSVSRNRFVT